jgi:anaerobic selenocysteine-containing dehydrogenase
VIPDEILTDHPARFRAMLIESSNPVHSLADSQRMRQALRALDLSVVIDVAMTETARQADYVLPASSQFEKAEATFFNLEFPRNGFHLRQPLFDPREGTLCEAEIHARLVESLGELGESQYRLLRGAARLGHAAFGLAFAWKARRDRKISRYASIVLYRTLGKSLPVTLAPAASLWGISQLFVRNQRKAAMAAGFGGPALAAGNKLFQAILGSPSGVIYSVSDYADSWQAVRLPDHKINLCVEEMLAEMQSVIGQRPVPDANYPFVLSAGERRSDTSNTSIRDASWHRRGTFGSLRMHPDDAGKLGCAEGDWVRLITRRGRAEAQVELGADLQAGHVSLPNGHGLDYTTSDGSQVHKGVSLNELTDTESRDRFAGTPWHKHVPVRIERIGAKPEMA